MGVPARSEQELGPTVNNLGDELTGGHTRTPEKKHGGVSVGVRARNEQALYTSVNTLGHERHLHGYNFGRSPRKSKYRLWGRKFRHAAARPTAAATVPPHLSFDLLMTATNGPLRRSYTPKRPSTGIFVDVVPVEERESSPAATTGASSIPASFRATTLTRAPPRDSGPRAIVRHLAVVPFRLQFHAGG